MEIRKVSPEVLYENKRIQFRIADYIYSSYLSSPQSLCPNSHNLDSTEGSRAVILENVPDLGVSDSSQLFTGNSSITRIQNNSRVHRTSLDPQEKDIYFSFSVTTKFLLTKLRLILVI